MAHFGLREIYDSWSEVSQLAIEQIASFGMPVGNDIFETVYWTGRFVQVWPGEFTRIKRKTICANICHTATASDANIKSALIDLYGGQNKAIGGKKCRKCKGKKWFGRGRLPCYDCESSGWLHPPGPLYELSKVGQDLWQALAVAVTFADKHEDLTTTTPATESAVVGSD